MTTNFFSWNFSKNSFNFSVIDCDVLEFQEQLIFRNSLQWLLMFIINFYRNGDKTKLFPRIVKSVRLIIVKIVIPTWTFVRMFPRYTWFVCQTGQKKYTLVLGVIGKNTWWEETNTKLNQFYEFTMFKGHRFKAETKL